ncbi:hypothetical protein H6F67_10925 [Microcoleus sp. FACHB-1515]|uniref:hypothetical protein n=1 Tax=Cyanophyceae TaxID=3028117 RepID=UPI001685E2CF|nr:hypothetical protein [Microcoleus sp. FACHB-1515]MBD2090367.1 hypothetical protein [Microcoleus sp. FACHB-1515]
MNTKERLIKAIEKAPESRLEKVLSYLLFLETQEAEAIEAIENQEDLEDALIALEEVKTEGTVSWESLKSEVGL